MMATISAYAFMGIAVGYFIGLLVLIIFFLTPKKKKIVPSKDAPLFVLHTQADLYFSDNQDPIAYDNEIEILARDFALKDDEWINSRTWMNIGSIEKDENNIIHLWKPKGQTHLEVKKQALEIYYRN